MSLRGAPIWIALVITGCVRSLQDGAGTTGGTEPCSTDCGEGVGVWKARTPSGAPNGRLYAPLTYDALDERTLLLGGLDDETALVPLPDLFAWDGSSWTRMPSSLVPARAKQIWIHETLDARTVSFGGLDPHGVDATTFVWDGAIFTTPLAKSAPPSRALAGGGFDTDHNRLVVFGGSDGGGGDLDDTWTFDAALETWDKTDATGPSARHSSAAAYDEATGELILFGGQHAGNALGDTWRWDGAAWSELSPESSPSARFGAAMTYDSARARLVLFGGVAAGAFLADTWEWDGKTWREVTASTAPPARANHGLAFDRARRRVVLFGGGGTGTLPSDTWELERVGNACEGDGDCDTFHCAGGVCCDPSCAACDTSGACR